MEGGRVRPASGGNGCGESGERVGGGDGGEAGGNRTWTGRSAMSTKSHRVAYLCSLDASPSHSPDPAV